MSSASSLPCAFEKCELASLALCQCCTQNLCIDHLNEHANQRNEKLLPFIDKVNILLNRFNNFYDGEHSCLKQLDVWKEAAYKAVDNFYDKKRRELIDETIDKQREELNEMNNKLKELIRKKGGTQQEFDSFSENMRSIEQHLDRMQQIPVTLLPLTIDANSICPSAQQRDNSIENTINQSSKSLEHTKKVLQKTSDNKKLCEKSSKKKRSSRRSEDSFDRSSRRRSRSPRDRSEHSKRKADKPSKSSSPTSSNHIKSNCDDCKDCRFYQDRFGPGFMDSFGPCQCECHKWAYTQ